MKKLLCLIIFATMLVGCSSSNEDKGKETTKDNNLSQKENEEKSDKKQKEDDSKDKKEAEENSKEDNDTKVADTKPKENKQNNQSTGGSSNGETTSPSNPSPPKEEKPTPPPPPVIAPPSIQQSKADQVFAQINAYRVQNGKEPFAYSQLLKNQADAHALAMANRQALWHSGTATECIANYDDPLSAWKNSPSHNEILLCNNTEGAVGIYYYNGYYYSVFQCQW